MNKKVKLTREQGRAMESFLRYNKRRPLEENAKYYLESSGGWVDAYVPLGEMGFEKFLQALMFGYEVKLTPHEVLIGAYETATPIHAGYQFPYTMSDNKDAFRNGIKTALYALGISVEGVYEHGRNDE